MSATKKLLTARNLNQRQERELWGRAAGRCEMCNKILYRSSLTQEQLHSAQKAHIYSFSENGPRGRGPFSRIKEKTNQINNIILLCPECHLLIDNDEKGVIYSPTKLAEIKEKHEERVEMITGFKSDLKYNILLFSSKIGMVESAINSKQAFCSLLADEKLPFSDNPIIIDCKLPYLDDNENYWKVEKDNLQKKFDTQVLSIIHSSPERAFAIFALAPIPLLIFLGTLFSDQTNTEIFQLHRNHRNWDWLNEDSSLECKLSRPETIGHKPVLIISLSGKISHERIKSLLPEELDFWELEAVLPNNDNIRCKEDLAKFRSSARQILEMIRESYSNNDEVLSIFPAMCVSCSITFGLCRMPKSDLPWMIYDNQNEKGFVKALSIGVN